MSLHDFRQQKTWSPGQGSKALQFFLSVTFWAFGAESTQAGSQHSPGSEQELMQSRQGTNLADSHTDFYPKDSHTMPALPGTGIPWTAHREAQLCSQGPARWAHKLQIKCLNREFMLYSQTDHRQKVPREHHAKSTRQKTNWREWIQVHQIFCNCSCCSKSRF